MANKINVLLDITYNYNIITIINIYRLIKKHVTKKKYVEIQIIEFIYCINL